MATVKHHKVVASLPAELEADALYLVRSGSGFDLYVTNHSGMIVAYPLNAPSAAASFFGLVTVTASATGQTEFAIPGGYTPGAIVVFLNGASLAPAHYTATDGAAVVLASGVGVVPGAELVVLRLSAFEVADALPLGGTAADATRFGGQLPSYYATQEDLAGVSPGPEFYQRSNILGIVSQLGGIPTGALVEYGINANGEYWRYAGGMQICIAREASGSQLTTAAGSLYRTGSNGWTFPAAFIEEPSFHPHSDGSPGYSWGAIGSGVTTTASATWSVFGPSSSANAPQGHLIAIGRWHN